MDMNTVYESTEEIIRLLVFRRAGFHFPEAQSSAWVVERALTQQGVSRRWNRTAMGRA